MSDAITFRDIDGLEVMRCDVETEEYIAHQLGLAHDGGDAMGLYSPARPLDFFMVLFRPKDGGDVWRQTVSHSMHEPESECYVTAAEGQAALDFWDVAHQVSLAQSLPE